MRLPAGSPGAVQADRGLRIGEAAELVGISIKAIRVYHARGILPEPDRDGSGYRRYSAAALATLARITRLRGVGLSLRQIESLLRAGEEGVLRARLRDLESTLGAEIAEREGRRALVAELLAEGIDDPIAIVAASPAEQRSIAALRTVVSDLSPEEELVERRLLRAMDLFVPVPDAESTAEETLAAMSLGDPDAGALADTHRRFHELVDASPTDPRVHELAGDFRTVLGAIVSKVQRSSAHAERSSGHWTHLDDRLHAALSVLAPAQRRVMELVLWDPDT